MVEANSTQLAESREVCPNCDSECLRVSTEQQRFLYGAPENEVELVAEVPVFTCSQCGYQFTDERAEKSRHDAVCRHLGVQTPDDIAKIREELGLNQAQFAELTGIGTASLSRWENGVLIQNTANDTLLYLMRFKENAHRLRNRAQRVSISAEDENAEAQPQSAEPLSRPCRIRPRVLREVHRVRMIALNWRLRVPY